MDEWIEIVTIEEAFTDEDLESWGVEVVDNRVSKVVTFVTEKGEFFALTYGQIEEIYKAIATRGND